MSIGTSTLALIFRKDVGKFPWNWLVFTIFTLSTSLVCGTLVALGDSIVGLLVFSSLASIINIYIIRYDILFIYVFINSKKKINILRINIIYISKYINDF